VLNLIYVGRIIKDKGVYELAKVAKHFENNNKIRFTILGSCEYGSENPFENLPNVECKGYDKNVRAHVEDAHAIILPSYHEGMANVLLEGAASGRPVLASNIPGCKESFDEGVTGFGFNVKDAQDTIRAVEKFLTLSYEEKRQMGILGRKKMENQFDRNIVISKYLEKLGEV
jgi:galacturonosyltransferase